MRKRLFYSVLAFVLAIVFLAGCSGGSVDGPESTQGTDKPMPSAAIPDPEAEYEENVYLGSSEDLSSPDPYSNTNSNTWYFTNLTFEPLIHISNADGKVLPRLATSWEANEDNTKWTFHLDPKGKFHDGSPFTSADVLFTWNMVTDGTKVVVPFTGAQVAVVDTIECPDAQTIVFNLKQPMVDFVNYMEFKMYSKTAFETLGAEAAVSIGTGPYYYNKEMTKSGVQFVASRFDDYRGGIEKYPTKNLIFVYTPNQDTMVAALQAGEVDFIFGINASQIATLEATGGLDMYSLNGTFSYYLACNQRKEMFKDPELRKAIAMGVDKESLIAVAYNGGIGGSISFNSCPPMAQGYTADIPYVKYDPEAAKAKLADLGYPNLKLVLAYPALEVNKAMCEVIQSSLSQIGIEVTLISQDVSNWVPFKQSDDYDMFVDCMGFNLGAMTFTFNRFFRDTGNANFYGYASEEYNKLQDKVTNSLTWDEAVAAFQEVQKFVAEDCPVFPLAYNKCIYAFRDDLGGLDAEVFGPNFNFMNVSTLFVEKR